VCVCLFLSMVHKISIEGPLDPGKEGGLKFHVDVDDKCVSSAKDSFVAAHRAKYSRTYSTDSFDLSHLGSILADDFCDMTSLEPPRVRIHRPRGVRRAPEINIGESKMKRSTTLYDLDMPPEDLYHYYHSMFDDLVRFSLTSFLGAAIFVVLALKVTIRRKHTKLKEPRIRVSRAKETKKVNINGVYTQISRTHWRRETKELPVYEIRQLKSGTWEFWDAEENVLAVAVNGTSQTLPSPMNVATWKWRDSRRPGEFALKIEVEI